MFFGYNLLASMPNSQLFMVMKQTEAQKKNIQLLYDMFNRWSNIGVSRLEWENLPSTVDERLLNMGLYLNGHVAFFQHEILGLIALPCNPGNRFNLFYQPTEVTAFGYDKSFTLSNENRDGAVNFAFMRFTPTGIPVAMSVFNLVIRMADILRSIDVIAQRMKRPYIILCDEKERLTIENLVKRIKDNEELVLGYKNYGLEQRSIEIAPTPSVADLKSLWESYTRYETQLYTLMGIDNAGYEKRERLVVDEVNANNMVIQIADDVNLKEMRLGLDRINEAFGTNIKVKIKDKRQYQNFTKGEGMAQVGPVYDNYRQSDR